MNLLKGLQEKIQEQLQERKNNMRYCDKCGKEKHRFYLHTRNNNEEWCDWCIDFYEQKNKDGRIV